MIQENRIQILRKVAEPNRPFVIYWMQASQREECNHALEFAIREANQRRLPLIVFFGLTTSYPRANERHYAFMLEGLKETKVRLYNRGIGMWIRKISPEKGITELARFASLIVSDRGYTKIQREWRNSVARAIDCPLIQVESDVVIPVETVSNKKEFSAQTIRKKIQERLPYFLVPLRKSQVIRESVSIDPGNYDIDALEIEKMETILEGMNIDRQVRRVSTFRGGFSEAKHRLEEFIHHKLAYYHELRNDPSSDGISNLSPYLHFGQISPLYVALKVKESEYGKGKGASAFLEELIVRRELSCNYAFFNSCYDSFDGLPDWCKKTLLEHELDHREYLYSPEELENAQTHDPYWNSAQMEMKLTGKMHGYMRMYWGKKILEWTASVREAYRIALTLNDKYELDGRDPNGFAGIAWVFGNHDRPWRERQIFGKIRYMNENGLRRKFNVDSYVAKVRALKHYPHNKEENTLNLKNFPV